MKKSKLLASLFAIGGTGAIVAGSATACTWHPGAKKEEPYTVEIKKSTGPTKIDVESGMSGPLVLGTVTLKENGVGVDDEQSNLVIKITPKSGSGTGLSADDVIITDKGDGVYEVSIKELDSTKLESLNSGTDQISLTWKSPDGDIVAEQKLEVTIKAKPADYQMQVTPDVKPSNIYVGEEMNSPLLLGTIDLTKDGVAQTGQKNKISLSIPDSKSGLKSSDLYVVEDSQNPGQYKIYVKQLDEAKINALTKDIDKIKVTWTPESGTQVSDDSKLQVNVINSPYQINVVAEPESSTTINKTQAMSGDLKLGTITAKNNNTPITDLTLDKLLVEPFESGSATTNLTKDDLYLTHKGNGVYEIGVKQKSDLSGLNNGTDNITIKAKVTDGEGIEHKVSGSDSLKVKVENGVPSRYTATVVEDEESYHRTFYTDASQGGGIGSIFLKIDGVAPIEDQSNNLHISFSPGTTNLDPSDFYFAPGRGDGEYQILYDIGTGKSLNKGIDHAQIRWTPESGVTIPGSQSVEVYVVDYSSDIHPSATPVVVYRTAGVASDEQTIGTLTLKSGENPIKLPDGDTLSLIINEEIGITEDDIKLEYDEGSKQYTIKLKSLSSERLSQLTAGEAHITLQWTTADGAKMIWINAYKISVLDSVPTPGSAKFQQTGATIQVNVEETRTIDMSAGTFKLYDDQGNEIQKILPPGSTFELKWEGWSAITPITSTWFTPTWNEEKQAWNAVLPKTLVFERDQCTKYQVNVVWHPADHDPIEATGEGEEWTQRIILHDYHEDKRKSEFNRLIGATRTIDIKDTRTDPIKVGTLRLFDANGNEIKQTLPTGATFGLEWYAIEGSEEPIEGLTTTNAALEWNSTSQVWDVSIPKEQVFVANNVGSYLVIPDWWEDESTINYTYGDKQPINIVNN